jgi:hypothetical protein
VGAEAVIAVARVAVAVQAVGGPAVRADAAETVGAMVAAGGIAIASRRAATSG